MNPPARETDILLTYPRDGLRLFQSMIPIGLVSIGTVLKKAGYHVTIIDFNHYSGDFRRHLKLLRPKIIAIGGTTPSRRGSFLTARIAKETVPDATVIYGGVNATFTAAEVLGGVPAIDYILKGEAELSMLSLCGRLFGGKRSGLDEIPGLCRRSATGVVENRPRRIDDLSVLPIPDRDLLGDFYRLEMEFIGGEADFIMTSRGCPAACNFCSASRMFPGGVRLRPMDPVMTEIEGLCSRRNLAGLKLFDSTFTACRDHVERFCSEVKRFNLKWECEVRADTVDAPLLRLMKESGCYYINVGMETTCARHLRQIAKGITPGQVLDTLAVCGKLGIRSKVFFTFGHSGQTFRECLDDIRFIEDHRDRIDFFAVTVGMRIYPGTRLEKDSREKGLLDRHFSWMRTAKKPVNLLLFEPGDVPLLFQKQLGPFRLLAVLLILLSRRLICTERFLLKMVVENLFGIVWSLRLQFIYTRHRFERLRSGDIQNQLSAVGREEYAQEAVTDCVIKSAGVPGKDSLPYHP